MKTIKTTLKSLPAIIISIIVVAGITYAAGSLTAPTGTPSATGYTLGDIYNKILDITFTPSEHSVSTTTDPATTFASLSEIYTALDNATTTLVAGNIADGVEVFGVTGTLVVGSPAELLKTGINACYDPTGGSSDVIPCSGSGQDGEYQSGVARSYTDNSNGTITDNSTGLMWVKDPSQLGGLWGSSGSPTQMLYAVALSECESLSYAGHTDWRLPNIIELHSIVFYDMYEPSTNTTYFPNTQMSGYWSSTIFAVNPYSTWIINFEYGTSYTEDNVSSHYARCVRG